MSIETKKDMEAKINKILSHFLKERLGEDTKTISSEVVDDAIIVRFKGVLPLAEIRLGEDPAGGKLIHELKMRLIEEVRPNLEFLIEDATGAKVIDMHSSFNLATGERLEIFTLNKKI